MSLTDIAHEILSQKFNSIRYGIDATCGNGYDALFLSRLCDENGIIYCFDIQEDGLKNTADILDKYNLLNKVKPIKSGHESIRKYVDHQVDVIMFNLGYLPNSNRSITTCYDTTIIALDSSKYSVIMAL